jgi:hypothetical protein
MSGPRRARLGPVLARTEPFLRVSLAFTEPAHKFTHANDFRSLTALSRNFATVLPPTAAQPRAPFAKRRGLPRNTDLTGPPPAAPRRRVDRLIRRRSARKEKRRELTSLLQDAALARDPRHEVSGCERPWLFRHKIKCGLSLSSTPHRDGAPLS